MIFLVDIQVRIETDPADRTQLRMTVASGDPTVTFEYVLQPAVAHLALNLCNITVFLIFYHQVEGVYQGTVDKHTGASSNNSAISRTTATGSSTHSCYTSIDRSWGNASRFALGRGNSSGDFHSVYICKHDYTAGLPLFSGILRQMKDTMMRGLAEFQRDQRCI